MAESNTSSKETRTSLALHQSEKKSGCGGKCGKCCKSGKKSEKTEGEASKNDGQAGQSQDD